MLQIPEREEQHRRSKRWKSPLQISHCTSEAVGPQEKTLGAVSLSALAHVLACPGVGDVHKNIFAQFNAWRSPCGCSPRASFGCLHVGQGSGAPDGLGGAAVSWCVHASPGRNSASLILVLSEKCESRHSRSDILNTISSPCAAAGQAHVLSRWTLNICCSCCPGVQTACKCPSFQSSKMG